VRLAYLLPAAIVVPLDGKDVSGLVEVETTAIDHYRKHILTAPHIVSRAPVSLQDVGNTEFVVFRGGEGVRDQVAVIVGAPDPNESVYVRIHSACLTGDLFASLKCDCGDQLRGTVARMAETGGGVLLYLDQEGRGSGIANKIRAYRLQHAGYDTYEADEILGFDLDQRRFDFAAAMLREPGVDMREVLNAIRYMTRTGGGWRMLPKDFPSWQTVYWWFHRFVRLMLFQTIHDTTLMMDRGWAGREASPSGGVIPRIKPEGRLARA